jgi:uncharacterized membrane protein SpoIIM required for sporulation
MKLKMLDNTHRIIFICIVISLLISIGVILIYDSAFTPNDLQKQIDNINSYLKNIIIGYTTP